MGNWLIVTLIIVPLYLGFWHPCFLKPVTQLGTRLPYLAGLRSGDIIMIRIFCWRFGYTAQQLKYFLPVLSQAIVCFSEPSLPALLTMKITDISSHVVPTSREWIEWFLLRIVCVQSWTCGFWDLKNITEHCKYVVRVWEQCQGN